MFYGDSNQPYGPFQKDYARIGIPLLSGAYRVKCSFLVSKTKFFRNRLTHSLEVVQILISILEMIQYDLLELYVVEVGALVHDMGNPPFGYAGEHRLNKLFHIMAGLRKMPKP